MFLITWVLVCCCYQKSKKCLPNWTNLDTFPVKGYNEHWGHWGCVYINSYRLWHRPAGEIHKWMLVAEIIQAVLLNHLGGPSKNFTGYLCPQVWMQRNNGVSAMKAWVKWSHQLETDLDPYGFSCGCSDG